MCDIRMARDPGISPGRNLSGANSSKIPNAILRFPIQNSILPSRYSRSIHELDRFVLECEMCIKRLRGSSLSLNETP